MAYGLLVFDAIAKLRNWLHSSNFKPGALLPSERQIAKNLGLNHYAVNRAMTRLITEGSLRREGYKLYFAEASVQTPGASCDLVVPGRELQLQRAYRKVARESRFELRIHRFHSCEEAVATLHRLAGPSTEHVIFDPPFSVPYSSWESGILRLAEKGIPTVCVAHKATGCSGVLPDFWRGVTQILTHLTGMGHREFGLVTATPLSPSAGEVKNAWVNACRLMGLTASQSNMLFYTSSRAFRGDCRGIARRLEAEWKDVTALVIFTDFPTSVPALVETLAQGHQRRVPQDLSIACLGDDRILQLSDPAITAVTYDLSIMHETAFTLLRRLGRRRQESGALPPPSWLRIEPKLALRASTAPAPRAPGASPPAPITSPEDVAVEHAAEVHHPEPADDIAAALHHPYPLVFGAGDARFVSVDLAPHVNRPLNFRRGWLGDLPLKNFSAGEHVIHGVPFQILGGLTRSNCGAVVFHSEINVTGRGQSLPDRLSIEINSPVQAIYILHGCGYAKLLQEFAAYRFYGKNGLIDTVPLVSLGILPASEYGSEEVKRANIQDWWGDFPHLDFPHARRAPIVESEDESPVQRHVYLYTLEWINPRPEEEVTHIEICADATQATTLGILAICVLKPLQRTPVQLPGRVKTAPGVKPTPKASPSRKRAAKA